jgi:hypothetical protein
MSKYIPLLALVCPFFFGCGYTASLSKDPLYSDMIGTIYTTKRKLFLCKEGIGYFFMDERPPESGLTSSVPKFSEFENGTWHTSTPRSIYVAIIDKDTPLIVTDVVLRKNLEVGNDVLVYGKFNDEFYELHDNVKMGWNVFLGGIDPGPIVSSGFVKPVTPAE